MAKQFDPSRFPAPPKQTFPVEIVPPANTGFDGGSGSFGGGGDFRASFLKFMQEAGEALGRAAAEEIGKVKLTIEGGEQRQQGEPLSGKTPAKQPGHAFAAQQFLRAANLPDFTKLAGMLTGPFIVGKLAGMLIHAPSNANALAESQRRFANVSPSMASAFAEHDVKGRLRDLTSGERLAPSNRELLREIDKFRDSAAQWGDGIKEGLNALADLILGGINTVVGPVTEFFAGKRKIPESLPWVLRLEEMRKQGFASEENEKLRTEIRNFKPPKP